MINYFFKLIVASCGFAYYLYRFFVLQYLSKVHCCCQKQ